MLKSLVIANLQNIGGNFNGHNATNIMDIKIGVIVIGSLLWETTEKRTDWRNGLSIKDKLLVDLPIRYGRQSLKNRKGTYSMVFSNNINHPKTLGKGYVIPFKETIKTEQDFICQMINLSNAEGISKTRICKSWGTVCFIANPFIDQNKKNEVLSMWNDLVNTTRQSLTQDQKEPEVDKFGEPTEKKSIDNNWKLTINLDNLFKNELKDFDILVATSNAVKLKDNINTYPTAKQIAKAINDSKHFEYFLRNTQYSIRTFQDRQIAKILKLEYRISLKKERKKLPPTAKYPASRV